MKTKRIMELIERAYGQFMSGKDLLDLNTWNNLNNLNISPAGLWSAFEAGFTPTDIYINQEIING